MKPRHFDIREACPGCECKHFTTVYERPYTDPDLSNYLRKFYEAQGMIEMEYLTDATFILARCANCDMVFQVQVPDEFLSERVYEHWINPSHVLQTLEGVRELEHYRGLADEILTALFALGHRNTQDLKFLDFGMGWALWCRMAMGFGVDAYGVELSKTRIEHGKSFGVKVITYDEIPQHKFNLINTDVVYEHLLKPLEILRHLARALPPDGLFKINVPDSAEVDYRIRHLDWEAHRDAPNSPMLFSPLEHINCFTYKSIIKMGEAAGLERARLPIQAQYAGMTGWQMGKPFIKNLVRPFYKNFIWTRTQIYLKPKAAAVRV